MNFRNRLQGHIQSFHNHYNIGINFLLKLYLCFKFTTHNYLILVLRYCYFLFAKGCLHHLKWR